MKDKDIKKIKKYAEKMLVAEREASIQEGLRHMLNDDYFKAKQKLTKQLNQLSLEDLKTVMTYKKLGEDIDFGVDYHQTFDQIYNSIHFDKETMIHKLTHTLKLSEYIDFALDDIKRSTQ